MTEMAMSLSGAPKAENQNWETIDWDTQQNIS